MPSKVDTAATFGRIKLFELITEQLGANILGYNRPLLEPIIFSDIGKVKLTEGLAHLHLADGIPDIPFCFDPLLFHFVVRHDNWLHFLRCCL
jgi:hypothetical protein